MVPKRRRRSTGDSSEDAFIAAILRLANWAQQNSRVLILGGIALAILAGGVIYYLDYRQRVTEVASTEIRSLRNQLRSNGGEQVVQGLRSFIGQFGDTPYATEARVLLAEELLQQGRATQALEPARAAAQRLGSDPLGLRAAFLLAAAHEEAGDTISAIRVYERIGRDARLEAERVRGLEAAARLYAASDQLGEAIEIYDRLLQRLPEDDRQQALYELRRAELEARRDRWTLSGT